MLPLCLNTALRSETKPISSRWPTIWLLSTTVSLAPSAPAPRKPPQAFGLCLEGSAPGKGVAKSLHQESTVTSSTRTTLPTPNLPTLLYFFSLSFLETKCTHAQVEVGGGEGEREQEKGRAKGERERENLKQPTPLGSRPTLNSRIRGLGAWMVQLVRRLTPDFGSGHGFVSLSPTSGSVLTVQTMLGIPSLSLSLWSSPVCALSPSLKINKST